MQNNSDSVAFRYIAAGSHPDHDTLATFRRRFIDELAGLFLQVLEMAREMKLLKMGTVCLDGTKIHANASRHHALSHGHIVKLEDQLKAEVQELLALAEAADTANVPDGMSLPKELKLREDRLAAMAAAKAKGLVETPDLVGPYLEGLARIVDLDAIKSSGLRLGIHPLGGTSIPYYEELRRRFGLKNLELTEGDPTGLSDGGSRAALSGKSTRRLPGS